jgi:hypothetical protein
VRPHYVQDIHYDMHLLICIDVLLYFIILIPSKDFEDKGREGSVLIELAPIDLVPCSVSNTRCNLFEKEQHKP